MDYVFEIVEGHEAGQQIPLAGAVEIGRDPDAGIPLLDDELVSRHHARVTPVADGVRVEDLGSRNGTFVDGDQIFSPAHVAVDGQLLVGTTVLQLRTAQAARAMTVVRMVPSSLTEVRPVPRAVPPAPAAPAPMAASAAMASPEGGQLPPLAVPESEPTYVPAAALQDVKGDRGVLSLLDVHTKSKARGAPIGLFVLAVLVVILYLALR